jgi:hypothetical protein
MARKAKTHYLGGRLIRAALKEFIYAHPVRNSAGEIQTIKQPE